MTFNNDWPCYIILTYGNMDTYMYLYESDQTTLIVEEDNGGSGNNALIRQCLNANTWYYVKVKAYSTTTGCYGIGVYLNNDEKSTNPIPVIGNSQVKKLIAYPNPVSDILTIESSSKEEGSCKIDLINASGHAILNQRIDVINGRFDIDMSDVSPGPYLLKIMTNKTVEIIRVIKN